MPRYQSDRYGLVRFTCKGCNRRVESNIKRDNELCHTCNEEAEFLAMRKPRPDPPKPPIGESLADYHARINFNAVLNFK